MALFNAKNLSPDKQPKNKKHCVLLVDDEIENISAISAILADDYQLITASNGEEALAILSKEDTPNISLIISDQRMPKMTGVELFEQAVEMLPQTMRIIVTGYMDVNAIIDSVNKAQIYRFILKPFERQDFLLTVQRAIESYEMKQAIEHHQEQLEIQVAQRTQELESAYGGLQETLKKVGAQAQEMEQLNRDKDKFISILSHDIRGPLGSLHMMTDLLEEKAKELNISHGGEIIHQINSLTIKIQKLVENILQWSRVHNGHIECKPTSISPYQLAEDAIEINQPLIAQHNIECTNAIDSKQMVIADSDMTWAIFRNFLSNAIKFTPDEGSINLSLKSTDKFTTITVANSGSYIPPEAIDKIFRIDAKYNMPGKRGEKGTGLGLLLCKEYMDKHKGEIGVSSSEEAGTSFYCSFPN